MEDLEEKIMQYEKEMTYFAAEYRNRDRAVSEMEYSEYVKRFGEPPTPLFK